MKKLACVLGLVSCGWGEAAIADEFQKVKCGADIPKAMIGQRAANGPVVAIEKKYRALGLKDLGGDELTDRLFSVSWQICGAEYIELLDPSGRVGDVLPFPAHSKRSPAFSGWCKLNDRDLPDLIIAILDGTPATDSLPVQVAWKIDQKRVKFVKMSNEGLVCPRSGIYDGDAAAK